MWIGGIAIWAVLSIPISFVLYLQMGRVLVYDRPILYKYPYTGEEISKNEYLNPRDFRTWEIFSSIKNSSVIYFILGFLLIMFTMSTLLISGRI